MRISKAVLQRYLSSDQLTARDLRSLLDDVGIEVKRLTITDQDAFYDLELLANRGDHRSYCGIARELHARTSLPLTATYSGSKALGVADTLGFEVATDRCSRYALAGGELLRGPPPSTALVRQLLDDEEERVGLSIVDVANAVQREMGQPLHLFDAAKVSGRLVVRESEAGERCRPLFKDEWVELPRGTLVVADDRAIHAVAGIIGCQDAEVTDDTRDILVEAACFDPVTIRKASRALGISTAASQRFERGSDPGAVTQALERFATLASEAGLGRVSTRSPLHAAAMDFQRCIPFSLARLRACLGWDLAGEVVDE